MTATDKETLADLLDRLKLLAAWYKRGGKTPDREPTIVDAIKAIEALLAERDAARETALTECYAIVESCGQLCTGCLDAIDALKAKP